MRAPNCFVSQKICLMLLLLSTSTLIQGEREELTCVACRDGFYLDDTPMDSGNDPVCRRCPANMFTRPERNASEQTHCLCQAGFTNSTGNDVCEACERGEYKPSLGNSTCSECPVNTNTLHVNSTDVGACLCNPGFAPGITEVQATDTQMWAHTAITIGMGTTVITWPGKNSIHPVYISTVSGWQSNTNNDYEHVVYDSTTFTTTITIPEGFPSALYYYCAAHGSMWGDIAIHDITPPCEPCPLGQFKDTLSNDNCLICPPGQFCEGGTIIPSNCSANSQSVAGSDEIFDCSCGPGFFAVFAEDVGNVWRHVCEECPAGRYNSLTNQSACQACPEDTYLATRGASNISACQACDVNSDSPAASTAHTECICRVGYSGEPGQACQACPPGYYLETTIDHICEACPTNTYNGFHASDSVDACLACPDNTSSAAASTALLACTCDAGHRYEKIGNSHYTCHECAPGSYQASNNQSACTLCAAGSFGVATGATAASTCNTCQDGYVALSDGSASCTACAAGKFQDLTQINPHAQVCTTCPANSTHTATASTDITDCRCGVGFAQRDDPHRCEICRAGYYCPGDGVETLCPFNHYSTEGSEVCTACANSSQALLPNIITVEQCKCVAGSEGTYDAACTLCPPGEFQADPDGGDCDPCVGGTYSSGRGNLICSACPGNSTSPPSSEGPTDCSCLAGFFGPDGEPCQECPKDKICPGGNTVLQCKLFSTGPKKSADPDACTCLPGYFSLNISAPCQACPPGSYCPGGTEKLPCPSLSNSNPHSKAITACHCIPGHWRNCIQVGDTTNFVDGSGQPCTINYNAACVECGEDVICRNNTLLHCPDNSASDEGSSLPHHCICDLGFKSVAV